MQSFCERLLEELEQIVERRTQPFETIYFGGGNPILLSVSSLQRIMLLATKLGRSKECTMEINPESCTETLDPLIMQGLSRLSIGIQSMDNRFLSLLGRTARRDDNLRSLAIAKQMRSRFGISINVDVITCLPGQSIKEAFADIDEVTRLSECEHISLYSLTVEEGTTLANQIENSTVTPLEEDAQADILASCWEHLASLGYEQYEVSNFSRGSSYRCLHNQRYWQLEEYVGLGPSAAGTLFAHGQLNRISAANDLAAYLCLPPFATYAKEELTWSQEVTEYLLVGLRTTKGIDKELFSRRFGIDYSTLFCRQIASLSPSWYIDTPSCFRLTRKGFMILDAIILFLVPAIDQGPT